MTVVSKKGRQFFEKQINSGDTAELATKKGQPDFSGGVIPGRGDTLSCRSGCHPPYDATDNAAFYDCYHTVIRSKDKEQRQY